MNQIPVLEIQENRHAVRQTQANLDHWYPVCWSKELKKLSVLPVTLWHQSIAVFRTQTGELRALENACLHKGVELHKGLVEGEHIVCAYHGWEFDGQGNCQHIPYLPEGQICPKARIHSYAVCEKYGIVWVFPGDQALANTKNLPDVPEYGDPSWFMVRIPGYFQAHFSICNENTMDVFHGHLHKDLQGWYDPVLTKLESGEEDVFAQYQVSYKGRMAKLLGLAKTTTEVCHRLVDIHYQYPHYISRMGDTSSLYLMRMPVGQNETRSFSLMFLKIGLPKIVSKLAEKILAPVLWQLLLKRFLDQDKAMMESEQLAYQQDPGAKRVEINPAISALRRIIIRQHKAIHTTSNDVTLEKGH